MNRNDIAIVGMACRFPGARYVGEFWQAILDGRSHFAEVPPDRWNGPAFHDPTGRNPDKTYTTTMANVDDIRAFAPAFFSITPKRAHTMDPQQRLLLECSRVALEDAGYARRALPRETTGVYTGISISEYRDIATVRGRAMLLANGSFGRAAANQEDTAAALVERVRKMSAQTMIGVTPNMAAANIARAFDLAGPVLAVDTACSSSLVALHEAVLHLRLGLTDAALVGGAYINVEPTTLIAFARIGALSKRGVCAPFDRRADGFVLGEGAGVVVLKRAADALRDGDRIWAIVNGIAVNNDGASDGPMAPSRAGQRAVLERAYRDAQVPPETVTLIEAHGTATAAGDAAEVGALGDFFGRNGARPVERTLTSVKGNIGHALAASGMAGLIKTALALSEKTLPAQASFENPNPELNLDSAGFRVSARPRYWESSHERRAGVSSFAFGGTNAHVVLSEPFPRTAPLRPARPLTFLVTAPDAALLKSYARQLNDTVNRKRNQVTVADVARTLSSRRVDKVGVSITASTMDELLTGLEGAPSAVAAEIAPETSEAREGGALMWLPPSPLVTGEYWVVQAAASRVSSEELAQEVEFQPAFEPGADAQLEPAVASLEPEPDAVLDAVMSAVAQVSGLAAKELSPSQALLDELGFDSLMSAELESELKLHFPALPEDTLAFFTRTTTIRNVADRISALVTTPSSPAVVHVSLTAFPWLNDHRIGDAVTIPFALFADLCLQAARPHCKDNRPLAICDISIPRAVKLAGGNPIALRLHGNADGDGIAVRLESESGTVCQARVRAAQDAVATLHSDSDLRPSSLSLEEFYGRHAFHGPSLRALDSSPLISDREVEGAIRHRPLTGESEVPILALDGALQAAAFWTAQQFGRIALPVGAREIYVAPAKIAGRMVCTGKLEAASGDMLSCNLDVKSPLGDVVLSVRGLLAQLTGTAQPAAPDVSTYQLAAFPEIAALEQRISETEAAGLSVPYFTLYDGVARDTAIVEGRRMVNFSSYNYLGLSGEPAVSAAAVEAVRRYGTSVSASRLASGERPVHRDLESAIASFLGCEDALAFVGGHATNVTILGHLLGPRDLILYDSLAHDSIMGGARLSGARCRPFPHNDVDALDRRLRDLRAGARRVLIAVEGVYSMDGDVAPLDRIIELKRRHRAILYVDEAHSLGVLGPTGRGIGEHYDVDRRDVDIWMGTLSKALASCGGYVAGTSELIRYLKFTVPGFIYSVGMSPANAAAALEAIRLLEARPERVSRLQAQSALFRRLCRERGIPAGTSEHSAVVPCIVGDSLECLRLAEALKAQNIAVHPIISPAVVERQARLRFFISALHTDEEIRSTVAALHEAAMWGAQSCLQPAYRRLNPLESGSAA